MVGRVESPVNRCTDYRDKVVKARSTFLICISATRAEYVSSLLSLRAESRFLPFHQYPGVHATLSFHRKVSQLVAP